MKLEVKKEGITVFDGAVDKKIITVGRGSASDVIIDAENCSRVHLEIEKKEDGIYIRNLSTANWTIFNGEKISSEQGIQYFGFFDLELPGEIFIKIED